MARILDSVLGHQAIISKLVSSFEMGRPGQTFLFVGPEGIGKKLTARGLAQALTCTTSAKACGICPSCLRLAKGFHESVKLVEPAGAQIKMDQAKDIIEYLSLKSLGGNRVVIIDQAHLLNPQAANALLKTLEEPPAGTFFFLLAPSAAGVLPTIRSRSRAVQFHPLSSGDLEKIVKAPLWALKSANGSFKKLAQLQEGPERELRLKAVEILKLFLNDREFLLNEIWRIEFKDRAQGQRLISYWVGLIKDAIYLQEAAEGQLVNQDQTVLIKDLSRYGRDFLLSLIQSALQVEQALFANRDPHLVMEDFYIRNRPS